MDNNELLKAAALNNAQWCDIVCSANNAPGVFAADMWHSVHQVPLYYPNMVMLTSDVRLEKVQQVAQQIPGSVSIKNSFDNLNLSPLGFRKLFDASWMLAPEVCDPPTNYRAIRNVSELERWEAAWGGGKIRGIFNHAVLSHQSVRFLAIYQADQIIAGAIVNKSDRVIGLSNAFGKLNESAGYWLTLVATAQITWPGLPVVYYAKAEVLPALKAINFIPFGPLSVWVK